MNFIYILSIIYLMISFLCIKKNNDKMSIVNSVIYSICLLFCYNILIVSIASFFNVGGSLFNYSLINYGIGSIFNLISFKKKRYQKYFFDKKELMVTLLIVAITFLICFIRFRGFTTLSYETGDPAVHYRGAIHFARELEILNVDNSYALIYKSFNRVMPISYVNCGFMMKILDGVPTYQVFIFFDVCCLMISSLLFFITMINVLKKKNYIYAIVLDLIYLLGFPLNNMLFGFCYLGLGVMIINLLFLTIFKIKDFNKGLILNIVILFIISFSVFFSYYLFMPCVYLALGIYYIYLWKTKKIEFRKLLLYGIITLIIPFVIGVIYFILPGFINEDSVNILSAVSLDGYIYNNKTPGYFFVILFFVFVIRLFKKKESFNYFNCNYVIISFYILFFYVLRMLNLASSYYFYKLFYLYWFFAIIFIGNLLIKRKYYLYTIFALILVAIGIVCVVPDSLFSCFLVKSNVFSWNARNFLDDKITFTKNELELVNESMKYEDRCIENNEFLISGHRFKNAWYYSITGIVPLYGYQYGKSSQLGSYNITFDFWKELENYKCLIYFYEDKKEDIDEDKLEILFNNEEGAILMKR